MENINLDSPRCYHNYATVINVMGSGRNYIYAMCSKKVCRKQRKWPLFD